MLENLPYSEISEVKMFNHFGISAVQGPNHYDFFKNFSQDTQKSLPCMAESPLTQKLKHIHMPTHGNEARP